jgi:excisionase family DNA binding protein
VNDPLAFLAPEARAAIETFIAEEIARQLAEERAAHGGTAKSPYLSIAQTAALLCCKRQRVDDLLSSGRLPRSAHDGRRVLIERAAVERYLAGGGR